MLEQRCLTADAEEDIQATSHRLVRNKLPKRAAIKSPMSTNNLQITYIRVTSLQDAPQRTCLFLWQHCLSIVYPRGPRCSSLVAVTIRAIIGLVIGSWLKAINRAADCLSMDV